MFVNFIASNLNDEEIKSIHTEMSETGDTERGYYNRCLRPLQIKFIGKHKEKIKRVIRLIKYWIKTNDVSYIVNSFQNIFRYMQVDF